MQHVTVTPPLEVPVLCRGVARHAAQRMSTRDDASAGRITVFVTHTKRSSPSEAFPEDQGGLTTYELVRAGIAGTRLRHFFDAADLDPGCDWQGRLDGAAATIVLLVMRSDRYSERTWTQCEVLVAKLADVPVDGPQCRDRPRPAWITHHGPRPGPAATGRSAADIAWSLGRVVDEVLKKVV